MGYYDERFRNDDCLLEQPIPLKIFLTHPIFNKGKFSHGRPKSIRSFIEGQRRLAFLTNEEINDLQNDILLRVKKENILCDVDAVVKKFDGVIDLRPQTKPKMREGETDDERVKRLDAEKKLLDTTPEEYKNQQKKIMEEQMRVEKMNKEEQMRMEESDEEDELDDDGLDLEDEAFDDEERIRRRERMEEEDEEDDDGEDDGEMNEDLY